MHYIPTKILISVCHSTQSRIAEEHYIYEHRCEKLGFCNTFSVRLNFNMEPTIHIA